MTATHETAIAAGLDAGNRSARKHGRARWSREDYNAACRCYDKVIGKELNGKR